MGQTGDGGSLCYEMCCLSRGLRLSAGYDAYAKDTARSSGGGESRLNAPSECTHLCVAGPLFAVVSSPPIRIRNSRSDMLSQTQQPHLRYTGGFSRAAERLGGGVDVSASCPQR